MNDTCGFRDCANPVYVDGLCGGHYQQRRRDPERPLRPLRQRGGLTRTWVWLSKDELAALTAVGAESVSAALRLVVEAWMLRSRLDGGGAPASKAKRRRSRLRSPRE